MGQESRRGPQKRLLEVGEILKTHPQSQFWGCALVLSTREATDGFSPSCLIGITPVIFQRDFAFSDLNLGQLSILQFYREIRAASGAYVPLRRETCIGIYAREHNPSVNVIGRVDVSSIYPTSLTFDVGDGANGGWPLCGPVKGHLGSEAVAAWRSKHDRERWLVDVAASRARTEEIFASLREAERLKRVARKLKKT